jgi:hypothetical protein
MSNEFNIESQHFYGIAILININHGLDNKSCVYTKEELYRHI